jgi:hypothetical protein
MAVLRPAVSVVRLLAGLALLGSVCPAWAGPPGAGFFVTADGYLVTSFWLVADQGQVLIRDADGVTHSAQLVRADPVSDLALLKAEGVFAAIPVRPHALLEPGQPVFVVNAAEETGATRVAVSASGEGSDVLRLGIPAGGVASGGPLFTAEGDAVAVIIAARDGVPSPAGAVAVRSEALLALISTEQPAQAQLLAPGEGQEARRAVVAVLSPEASAPAQPDRGELVVAEMYRIGNQARLLRDYATARRWLLAAALRGHAPAQTALGALFAEGLGGAADDAEALRWYRAAALQGEPEAQARLGWLYAAGRGVGRDDDQAVAWMRRAAEAGNAAGQNALGVMYRDGRGVYRDDAKAAAWFRRAALQGDAEAQVNLGLMFRDGREVEQDPAEAAWWFRRAAHQGHAGAREYLQKLENTHPRRDP